MLTTTEVTKLAPKDKPYKVSDGQGLFLLVTPSGGKLWRLKFRFGGQEKLLALGKFPEVGVKAAREKRDAARKQHSEGIDPAQARKDDKAAEAAKALNSLEAVTRAWLDHRTDAWTDDTREKILASFENHVFGHIGDKAIADITPGDIRVTVQRIDAAGARDVAERVFQRLRGVCRYAIAHDLIATDPSYPLKPAEIFRAHKVTHRASMPPQQMPAFLRKLDAYDGRDSTRQAMLLLILTGVRPGEIRGAAWSEFDLDAGMWAIPGPRMKMKVEHLVPLSTQAVALLRTMKAEATFELLFPSRQNADRPISDGTLNAALDRMGYGDVATAHGFRTVFSTAANEHGFNRDVIEKQLAHEERNAVRGAYNRAEYLPERSKLMQWWADRIDSMRKGADVIPLRAA